MSKSNPSNDATASATPAAPTTPVASATTSATASATPVASATASATRGPSAPVVNDDVLTIPDEDFYAQFGGVPPGTR